MGARHEEENLEDAILLVLHDMVPLLEGFTSALPSNCPGIQKQRSRFRMPRGLVSFICADFEK